MEPNEQNMTAKPKKRTVQSYLDEAPLWADGTPVNMVPLTRMQWLIWVLATAGKFFEGMVVFMTGIALPLIQLEFNLNNMESGIIGSATLVGILIGASALGGLADKYGRKTMFIVEIILFVIFVIVLCLSPWFWLVALMLLGAGIALGCDYPTAHLMISETIPSRNRGKLVLGAFAFQSVGALVGTGLGWIILYNEPVIEAWRWMYAFSIIPAIIVIIGRFMVVQSPHFLVSQGKYAEAQKSLSRLLKRDPKYPKTIRIKKKDDKALSEIERKGSYKKLFTNYRRETIFASLPWFLQDLGTYGIGVFTPIIIAAIIGGQVDVNSTADVIHNDMIAAKSTAFIDIFFFIGIIFAIFLSDILGRMRLQIFGFIGCAAGLAMAAVGHHFDNNLTLIFIGFIVFQFMTNLGPNAQTYVIAGEVFPVKIRGKGAGFAASFAKIGAIMTTFLFPWLISTIGTTSLLVILIGTSILGAWVTRHYGFETRGTALDNLI